VVIRSRLNWGPGDTIKFGDCRATRFKGLERKKTGGGALKKYIITEGRESNDLAEGTLPMKTQVTFARREYRD